MRLSARALFKLAIFNLAAMLGPNERAAAFADCGEPPAEWREYLKYDQDRNVVGRQPLTAKEKKTQAVYEFEVDTREADYRSMRKNPKDIPPVASLFVAQSWTKLSKKKLFRTIGSTPRRVLCGQKVTSNNTVFVWDPNGARQPFFAKPNSHEASGGPSHLFEAALNKSDHRKIGFLAETDSVRVDRWASTWSGADFIAFESLRRETTAAPGGPRVGTKLLPLHGFLGSALVDEAAKKSGMSRDEWLKKIYVADLAEYFDTLHFDIAFMHTDHTQNLLIEYNETTGKIERFVLRDLWDLYPDYFKLMTEKKVDVSKMTWGRRVNGWAADKNVKYLSPYEISTPGTHFGLYSLQSITAAEPNAVKQIELAEEFVKLYVARVEKRLGKPLALSEKAVDALNWLSKHDPRYPKLDSTLVYYKVGHLNAAIAEIVGSVHDNVARANAAKIPVDPDPFFQLLARTVLFEERAAKSVAFATADAGRLSNNALPQDWKFAFDGKRVYAIDATGQVVAATFNVPEPRRTELLEAGKTLDPRITCPIKYAKLKKK